LLATRSAWVLEAPRQNLRPSVKGSAGSETSAEKNVNVERFYNKERLRPKFESFEMTPLFIMTSDAI